MKTKLSITSDNYEEYYAEAKDLGISANGNGMKETLENMLVNLSDFFSEKFGSTKQFNFKYGKIKASVSISISPIEEDRPETPLTEFGSESGVVLQNEIDGENLLQLTEGDTTEFAEVEDGV